MSNLKSDKQILIAEDCLARDNRLIRKKQSGKQKQVSDDPGLKKTYQTIMTMIVS